MPLSGSRAEKSPGQGTKGLGKECGSGIASSFP